MTDLVSIIIPSYNSAATISETIDSCLAQSYQPIEIIVVDDGSSDETVAIVQAYGEKLRLIQQVNQGPAIARNTGIKAAKGAYLQFCDSDDLLHPEKVAQSMDVLSSRPDAALVFCQMQAIDSTGQLLEIAPSPASSFFEEERLFCKILKANGSPIQTSTILARKAALEAVGNYRADPHHRCAEDWDLLLRLAQDYPILGIQEALVKYRHREGALTSQTILMAEGRLQTIRHARDYAARKDCMTEAAFDALEAGRWHVLAVAYWERNERQKARHAFLNAAKISSKGALLRRIYANLCLFFPVSLSDTINNLLKAST